MAFRERLGKGAAFGPWGLPRLVERLGRVLAVVAALGLLPAMAEEQDTPLTSAEVTELAESAETLIIHGGDLAEIENSLRQLHALAVQDFGPDTREVLQLELAILMAVQQQTRLDDFYQWSRSSLERGMKVLAPDDPLLYRLVGLHGFALLAQGEGDTALGLIAEALSDGETRLPADDLALLELRLVQAVVATAEDRFDLAEATYRQVDTVLQARSDAKAKAIRVMALQGWAQLMAKAAAPEEAIPVLRAAISALEEQWQTARNPRMVPLRLTMLATLADMMNSLGQRAEVAAMLRPELAEIEKVYGKDSPQWADLATRLASAVGGETASPEAQREAADLMRQTVASMELAYPPETVALLDARVNLAVALTQTGEIGPAVAQIRAMQGLARAKDRGIYGYVLHTAQEKGLIGREQAVDAMLALLQQSQKSGAGAAQRVLAARLAAGSGPAADLLRERSDHDRALRSYQNELASLAAIPLDERNPAATEELRKRIAEEMQGLAETDARIARERPDLAAVTANLPLPLQEIRRRLGPEAALVLIDPPAFRGDAGIVIAVSQTDMDWHTFQVEGEEVADAVKALRQGIGLRLGLRAAAALDEGSSASSAAADPSFDPALAHWLYRQTLWQVAPVFSGKALIYMDIRGSLSALPPQLLVVSAPSGAELADVDWLVRHHAVAILPALSALPDAGLLTPPPAGQLLAFADADFAGLAQSLPEASQTALRGSLAPLPETADEARDVAKALGADPGAVRLGARASERAFKAADLTDIGTLYLATHGLVSGDQVGAAVLEEPALALTPGEGEDGFLTASEIADLKLDAGLVVLSACNTAAGGEPGADSLSGLAQSFLYAGARGLLVSHWPVESRSAVALMTGLFRARAAHPGRPLALAQQEAILRMLDDPAHPGWAHPAYWAPFVVVGSPE